MKISSIETFLVPPRWCFLRMETDDGTVGWGEPVVEGRAHTVAAAVDELADYLIGKDPLAIEDHWSVLYRGGFYRGGPVLMSAIAGIDQALWDIAGKHFGAPVWQLLGGRLRDRIRVYSWIGGDRPDAVVDGARTAVERGFTAVKMNGTAHAQIIDSWRVVEEVVSRVTALREVFGNDLGIGVDFHGRVAKPMAKVILRELEHLHPMFVEEPVLSENLLDARAILEATSIPIALGERLYSRWDFKPVFQSGLVDIIQPDLSHAGGITECRKIATAAETHDVAVAFHCPLGPIALASCLQLDAVSYTAVLQEQSLGIHYNTGNDLLDYLVDPTVFQYADGHVAIPDGPGLGIEVHEEYVREQATIGHRWRNPVWRHADGSVAEW